MIEVIFTREYRVKVCLCLDYATIMWYNVG